MDAHRIRRQSQSCAAAGSELRLAATAAQLCVRASSRSYAHAQPQTLLCPSRQPQYDGNPPQNYPPVQQARYNAYPEQQNDASVQPAVYNTYPQQPAKLLARPAGGIQRVRAATFRRSGGLQSAGRWIGQRNRRRRLHARRSRRRSAGRGSGQWQWPLWRSHADDGPHAHRRTAPRSADSDHAGRNPDGPADVRRGCELRRRPGRQRHDRRAELRLAKRAHELGRRDGRAAPSAAPANASAWNSCPAPKCSATWSPTRTRT